MCLLLRHGCHRKTRAQNDTTNTSADSQLKFIRNRQDNIYQHVVKQTSKNLPFKYNLVSAKLAHDSFLLCMCRASIISSIVCL